VNELVRTIKFNILKNQLKGLNRVETTATQFVLMDLEILGFGRGG